MVRKKLRKLKRKVEQKANKAEKSADLKRRVEKQKQLDRERRIKRGDPKGIVESAKVVRKDVNDITDNVKRFAKAKKPTPSDRTKQAASLGETAASKFFVSDEESSLYDSGSDMGTTDTSPDTMESGIDVGEFEFDEADSIDVGDFDFGGDDGGGGVGSFDLNDDDDLFG